MKETGTAMIVISIPGDEPPQLQGSAHLDRLAQVGEIRLHKTRPTSDAEKIERIRDATCLINSRGSVKWPGHVLAQAAYLKMVGVCGIGTDAIDLDHCRSRGIAVCNLPGRTAAIVAEHALGLLFAIAKRAWFQTNELKQGRWNGLDNFYLHGKLLGVLGAGPIALQMAKLARGIGMRVQGWTFRPTPERAGKLGGPYVAWETLWRTSDAVSVHLPLSDQTRHLIGAREFAMLKQGGLFVNTARGAVVDGPALVAALDSRRLAGAALDVFESEPLPANDPILGCAQVVLTPHNADQTPEGTEMLNGGVVDNVLAFLSGTPTNRVV